MKKMKWMLESLVCLFAAFSVLVPLSSAAEVPAVTVGRIFHVEGNLLRYVPEEKDWVAVVRDAPFGVEDTLFSGSDGMAELIVPNGIWIRIGTGTQIQFMKLDSGLAEIDVASGSARFYNKGSQASVKVTSPFGYVLADPGTTFDLYLGGNSVEVVAIKGTVNFVHTAKHAKYEVMAGTPSLVADTRGVSSGEGTVDPDWNRWNMTRENFWLTRNKGKCPTLDYLPPDLHYDAYTFEENGRWEMVPYEGAVRWFWRPTAVSLGWAPFTMGRWIDWYGDQTWIPAEPFGYTTHHYGNWIYVNHYWYWAPPVVNLRIGFPLLDVGFFWSPGRVSWIYSGFNVGWVPLAPHETYYAHRNWGGPHTVVVSNANIGRINISVRNHTYAGHAIIIPQNRLYDVNNYSKIRINNINRMTVVNNYRTAPFVNSVVLNYSAISQRYNYTNAAVKEKPHSKVMQRIQHNETVIRKSAKGKAVTMQEHSRNISDVRVNGKPRVEQPKRVSNLVPAKEVNRPKAEARLEPREIRSGENGASKAKAIRTPAPERVIPVRTAQPAPSMSPAGRVISGTPTQPKRVAPERPAQQQRAVQPERFLDRPKQRGKFIESNQSFEKPDRMMPLRLGRQGKP